MFDHIETQIETITKRSLTLVLTEDEVNAILIDPRKFQKALRAQRNTWYDHNGSTWSATGHRQKPAAKDAEKKSSTRRGKPKYTAPDRRKPCPICGDPTDPRGLSKHLAKHERQRAAGLE